MSVLPVLRLSFRKPTCGACLKKAGDAFLIRENKIQEAITVACEGVKEKWCKKDAEVAGKKY